MRKHYTDGIYCAVKLEANVDFLFGLPRNERLVAELAAELASAEEESKTTGQPARRFKSFAKMPAKHLFTQSITT